MNVQNNIHELRCDAARKWYNTYHLPVMDEVSVRVGNKKGKNEK